MKGLSHFLIFFGVFWSSWSYGQMDSDPQDDPYVQQQVKKIVPPCPSASSLGIYGSVPVGHYTGVPDISIPIYEIQAGDLTLPITLSYNASGIKVAQEASTVGLGWGLNAGGCIVREIKHLDDLTSTGYYMDKDFPECDANNDPVVDFVYKSNIYNLYYYNYRDSQPDIFKYNFGNMSGSFFFERSNDNINNTPQRAEAIISNKKTYLKIIYHRASDEKYFEIIDAYGNTYLFGSRENTRTDICTLKDDYPQEQHLNRRGDYEFGPGDGDVTTAWYLDQIITSKRDTIKFEYEAEKIYSTIRVVEDVCTCVGIDRMNRSSTSGGISSKGAADNYKYYFMSYTMGDQLLLKKISFNSGEINISYTDRKDIESARDGKYAQRVDWVTIKNKSNNYISRVKFDYSYLEDALEGATPEDKVQNALNCRLLLDGISIYRNNNSLDQKYAFSYNRNPLPRKDSRYTDHWGYYNEDPEPLTNKVFYYAPSYFKSGLKFKGINKNPSVDRSQYGILTSIQYPTGGKTYFEYELNDFDNGYFDSTDSLMTTGGGLRIKNIYNLTNAADTASVRSFSYRKNGRSTGVLMTTPVYHTEFPTIQPKPELTGGRYINTCSNPFAPIMGSAAGMYVGYSYVEERNITHGVNNGYVAYSFRNTENKIIHLSEDQCIRNYPSIPYLDNGLPTEIAYFDGCGNRVKSIRFSYERAEQKKIKGVICAGSPLDIDGFFDAKFYDVCSERWGLKEKTEYQYFPDDWISYSSRYEYNDTTWLKKRERISLSGQEGYDIRIKYPSDYGSALSGMVDKNMLGIPVEITRTKNGNVISGNKTTFRNFNNGMYLPQTYSEWDTNEKDYFTQYTIDRYDTRGNILQLTAKDNVPTTYLWSYSGEYPVVGIRNATYSQVFDALGASAVKAVDDYDGSSPAAAPDFRAYGATLRSKLPDAFVSVYTYKPLVGGTGVTDPSGRTTQYEYDPFNRLSEIKDDQGQNGNLIQKFEYQLADNDNYILTRTYTAANNSGYVADVDYYDGLGYLSQSINIGASPEEKSIITPVYYDAMRRESRQYLPYAASNSSGAYRPAALTEQVGYYNDIYGDNAGGFSYAESMYEPSPLNRVTASYNVGEVFRANDKKSTFGYGTNAGDEVMRFKVSAQGLEATGFYDTGTLFKNTVTNEDATSAVTYKDLLDRVILERVVGSADDNAAYDTYYVYDDIGNLCYVLPPALSVTAASWASGTVPDAELGELAYVYKYDGRNRCIEKHLPGAASVYMVYDKGDRVVMTQDGNMREQNRWTYDQYDALGRPVRQSILVSRGAVAPSTLQNNFDAAAIAKPYNPLDSGFTEDVILSKTVYDTYVYEDETITADQIPVGTNIRGWKFKVTRTDLTAAFPDDIVRHLCINGEEWISFIRYLDDPEIIICNSSIQATEENIKWICDGGWYVNEGYTFTIKDDRDYIVTENELPAGSETVWGFDRMVAVKP